MMNKKGANAAHNFNVKQNLPNPSEFEKLKLKDRKENQLIDIFRVR